MIPKRDDLLTGDFWERITLNQSVYGQIFKLIVAAQHRPILQREDKVLLDRDVDLDAPACRQRSHVLEIEGMTVRMALPVFMIARKLNPRRIVYGGTDRRQPLNDLLK